MRLTCSISVSAVEWDRYVDSHPDASMYHGWVWRHVFERVFGHDTVYLAARRGEDVVGVLPLVVFRSWLFGRFMVSLPFVNYGGVLASDTEAAEALLQAACEEAAAHRCAHVELRHVQRCYADLPVKQHKVAMTLTLPATTADAWNAIDRKARNQVRKAQKSGFDVVTGGSELVDDFYRVFAVNMRDLGTPVYSRAFFQTVLLTFPDRARVYVVRDKGRAVAAGITLEYRDRIELPWASSLREYRPLCPNNLLYWSVIEQAIHAGCRVLDLGRSTPGEGTYEFKRQWGAVAVPVSWEYVLITRQSLPDQSPANPRFKQAIALWQRLPVTFTTTVGPAIVRSIP